MSAHHYGRQKESPTTLNGFFSLADQVVVSGTRFLITVIIARSCGESVLGIYALVLSLIFISIMCQQTLITTPFANFRHRKDLEQEHQYLTDIWFMSLLASLIAAAAILSMGGVFRVSSGLFSGEEFRTGSQQLAWGCVFAALATPFVVQLEFFRRVLLIRMQAKWALVLDATANTVVVALLVMTGVLGKVNANVVFLIFAIVNAIAVVIAFSRVIGTAKFNWASVKKNVARHWEFGKWIFGSEAVTFGRGNLLKWIIGGFLGLGATGIYSACDSLMRAINPYFLGVASVAEPTLAKGFAESGKREVRRLALKVMLIMAAGTLPICLTVALTSPLLLYHLFDAKFAEYSLVVVWLSAASFMSSLGYPLANSLQAIDRPDINFRIRLATMTIVVVGSVIAAYSVGLWGIAMMQFVGSFIAFALRALFFNSFLSNGTTSQEMKAVG